MRTEVVATALEQPAGTTAEAGPMPAPASDSLTTATAQGFIWATTASIAARLVAILGQFVLAWLLSKEDFGWVALALAISAFPAMLHAGGITNVLVQRQSRLKQYASPCFWMGSALALLAALLILAAAPVAAQVTGSQTLAGLLCITALNTLVTGMGVVPMAMLQIGLRFKLIAILAAATTVVQTLVAVPLAWLGFGPFSVMIGTTVGTGVMVSWCWLATRPRIRPSPQVRRWKYVLGDTSSLLITNLLWQGVGQGDRLILGSLLGKSPLGVYFFANNLSVQVSGLLSTNLSAVLFPTFSRLTDQPARQLSAFLRAARVMALIGVPLTLLQAALADSGVRILFGEKWVEAIPVLQWFSVGMAGYVVAGTVSSLLMAQRRFRMLLWIAVIYAPVFLGSFVLCVVRWGATGGAAAVCVCYWLASILGMYAAVRRDGGRLRDVVGIYLFPLGASVAALGPAVYWAGLVPAGPWEHWVRATIITASMALIYPLLILVRGGGPVEDLRAIVGTLLQRFRRVARLGSG